MHITIHTVEFLLLEYKVSTNVYAMSTHRTPPALGRKNFPKQMLGGIRYTAKFKKYRGVHGSSHCTRQWARPAGPARSL